MCRRALLSRWLAKIIELIRSYQSSAPFPQNGFWETSIPDLHLKAGHQRIPLVILRLLAAMLPSCMNSWPYTDHTTTKNACRALNYRCCVCTRR